MQINNYFQSDEDFCLWPPNREYKRALNLEEPDEDWMKLKINVLRSVGTLVFHSEISTFTISRKYSVLVRDKKNHSQSDAVALRQ